MPLVLIQSLARCLLVVTHWALLSARAKEGADERDEATADSYGFIVASKALSSASQAGRAYQRSSGH
jgi:hypothetical protein